MVKMNYKLSAEPKVSVVMPVYNTESYVAEAMQSILGQTLRELELIVVNDGSTDNSQHVIEEMAAMDSRVRIYAKKNEGPSAARNLGLQKAIGQYVYFMDSDDHLQAEALADCYNRCADEQLDFVFFDADAFNTLTNVSVNEYYLRENYLDAQRVYRGSDLLDVLIGKNMYRPSVWLCLLRRGLLDEFQLSFYPGIIHEDELFTALFHLNAQRVAYLPKPYFRRRVRPNSITSSKFALWNMECYFVVLSELKKYACGSGARHAAMVEKLCAYILNPAVYRTHEFTLAMRMRVFWLCRRYDCLRYLTVKNRLILFFPFLIKIKGAIK